MDKRTCHIGFIRGLLRMMHYTHLTSEEISIVLKLDNSVDQMSLKDLEATTAYFMDNVKLSRANVDIILNNMKGN